MKNGLLQLQLRQAVFLLCFLSHDRKFVFNYFYISEPGLNNNAILEFLQTGGFNAVNGINSTEHLRCHRIVNGESYSKTPISVEICKNIC